MSTPLLDPALSPRVAGASRSRCCWAPRLRRRRSRAGARPRRRVISIWTLALVGVLAASGRFVRLAGVERRDWLRTGGRRCVPGRSRKRAVAIPGTPARVTAMQTLRWPSPRRRHRLVAGADRRVYATGRLGHADRLVRATVRACAGSRATPPTSATRTGRSLLADSARRHGRAPRRPPAAKPRADMPMAFGTRRPSIVIPADRRHVVRRPAARGPPARAGARRPPRLPDPDAGVRGLRDLLVPSGRVVGRAAAAHRARARLRRPRDRRRHRGPRLRRSSARDRVLLRRPPGAGARRQHGAAAAARRPHARGARRRAQPARAGVARARSPGCSSRRHCCSGHRRRHADRRRAAASAPQATPRPRRSRPADPPVQLPRLLDGSARRGAQRDSRPPRLRPPPCRSICPARGRSVRPRRKAPSICGWSS